MNGGDQLSFTKKFLVGHLFFKLFNQKDTHLNPDSLSKHIDTNLKISEQSKQYFYKETNLDNQKNITTFMSLVNKIMSVLTGNNIIYTKLSLITKIQNFFYSKQIEKKRKTLSKQPEPRSDPGNNSSSKQINPQTEFINDPIKFAKKEFINNAMDIWNLNNKFFENIGEFNTDEFTIEPYEKFTDYRKESITGNIQNPDSNYLAFEYEGYDDAIFLTKTKDFSQELKNRISIDHDLILNLEVFYIYNFDITTKKKHKKKDLGTIIRWEKVVEILESTFKVSDELEHINLNYIKDILEKHLVNITGEDQQKNLNKAIEDTLSYITKTTEESSDFATKVGVFFKEYVGAFSILSNYQKDDEHSYFYKYKCFQSGNDDKNQNINILKFIYSILAIIIVKNKNDNKALKILLSFLSPAFKFLGIYIKELVLKLKARNKARLNYESVIIKQDFQKNKMKHTSNIDRVNLKESFIENINQIKRIKKEKKEKEKKKPGTDPKIVGKEEEKKNWFDSFNSFKAKFVILSK